jgi:hypothetical protein
MSETSAFSPFETCRLHREELAGEAENMGWY